MRNLDKYYVAELLEYLKQMKDALQEAPIDFLGTGSNSDEAQKAEDAWNYKWMSAYVAAETVLESAIK